MAAELGLNCVIHQREALEDTLALLQPFADRVRGVFHCFANDAAAMRRIVALGSLVSFTGILTFKNGQNIRDALAATPLDQFMLETDCPFLAPDALPGQTLRRRVCLLEAGQPERLTGAGFQGLTTLPTPV